MRRTEHASDRDVGAVPFLTVTLLLGVACLVRLGLVVDLIKWPRRDRAGQKELGHDELASALPK